ncbi:IorB2: indolepyruvate ferredoxin oxidoreductase, subunit beta [Desulfosarcina variabilis str. Montpellier]|uniref:2-oxoacid:acceptor oxidoreductase family protein n=1 Tax=Desulfosarcina variabilis TaxID=2300 RepID=UPI003AFAFB02
MTTSSTYQIVISGVGGQGVLFITRLLAEAAIAKGLPVFTSETHGMAQRGGTVISHLKVGEFTSPLINPGRADGLIALKAESLVQHGGYIKQGGWAIVNSAPPVTGADDQSFRPFFLDADRLAQEMDTPKTLNLLMLGFALASMTNKSSKDQMLYCNLDDITAILKKRLEGKPGLLQSAIQALSAGAENSQAIV